MAYAAADAAHAASVSPDLDAWIVRRLLAGAHPKALVAATGGTVSLRTAYRWKREIRGITEVQVGEHAATFVVREGRPPIRVTDWRPKPRSVRRARAMNGTRCGRWMPIANTACGRFAGHRSQCSARMAMDANAQAERAKRAARRRERQQAAAQAGGAR
jgi:hypothetical protein